MDTKEKILKNFEKTFSLRGFAGPGIAELKKEAGVSLRTLYRYFPSKIDMISGVLDYRHEKYKDLILNEIPAPGYEAIVHIFRKLDFWMEEVSPNGCLYLNALSSYPDEKKIKDAVKGHKCEILEIFKSYSGKEGIEKQLYLLYEGVSSAWPLIGDKATKSCMEILEILYKY